MLFSERESGYRAPGKSTSSPPPSCSPRLNYAIIRHNGRRTCGRNGALLRSQSRHDASTGKMSLRAPRNRKIGKQRKSQQERKGGMWERNGFVTGHVPRETWKRAATITWKIRLESRREGQKLRLALFGSSSVFYNYDLFFAKNSWQLDRFLEAWRRETPWSNVKNSRSIFGGARTNITSSEIKSDWIYAINYTYQA